MKCDVFRGLATVCRRELLFVVHKGMYLTYFSYYIIKWMNVGEKNVTPRTWNCFALQNQRMCRSFHTREKSELSHFKLRRAKYEEKKTRFERWKMLRIIRSLLEQQILWMLHLQSRFLRPVIPSHHSWCERAIDEQRYEIVTIIIVMIIGVSKFDDNNNIVYLSSKLICMRWLAVALIFCSLFFVALSDDQDDLAWNER